MEKKIYSYFRKVLMKVIFLKVQVDLINQHFKLEFFNSGLYFVQDENNFINPVLQIGTGSN